MTSFFESTLENAALAWLETIDWRVTHGLDTALDMHAAERRGHGGSPHRSSCKARCCPSTSPANFR